MVRRYAHMSTKHLQPYADQLIFEGTKAPARPSGINPGQGHKNGHRDRPTRIRLVAEADLTNAAAIFAVDRHQNAHAKQHGKLGGTAETDQGQRNADDRCQAHHHRQDQQTAPDEAPFLRHRCEDEVGVAFGQIVEVALRTVEEALAPQPARTDRDLGLADVIAGAEGVTFGIEEDEDAISLIVVQRILEGEGACDRDSERATDEQAHRNTRQEHHRDAAAGDHQRGAEIGLLGDQRGRNADQQAGRPDRAEAPRLAGREHVVEARAGQHDGGLHEFGWLQLDADVEPALAAAAYRADQFNQHQRNDDDDIGRQRRRSPDAFGHVGDRQGHAQQDEEADALRQRPGLAAARSDRGSDGHGSLRVARSVVGRVGVARHVAVGDGGAHRRLRRIGEIGRRLHRVRIAGDGGIGLGGVGRGLRCLGGAIGGGFGSHARLDVAAPSGFDVSEALHRAVAIEQPRHDVAADHRRVEIADGVAIVFEHDRGGVAGIVGGSEADEQSVVAQLEGQLPVLEHARAPFCHGDAADLGGARLRRDGDARDQQPRRAAGAALVHHAVHRVPNDREMLRSERQRRCVEVDVMREQARLQRATRREPRRHDGKLQRVGEHIALADRRVQTVSDGPFRLVFPQLPFGIWHRAVTLRRQRQIELLPQPHHPRDRGDLVVADTADHFVEIDVAALFDRALQVERTVAAALVAVEDAGADAHRARADDAVMRADACGEQRETVHRLHRRSRRPGVDRQLLRLAGDVGTSGQFGDDLAACGDFDALGAWCAAEFTFQLLFKAILAELETRCATAAPAG
ncbi:hypothetical protein WR25_16397 [Diploscapter pachys]|uniref:Uncharacterized protein n=1 Tax=Diploscapter pachys TaxID=2018661 RepID=A0A2A2K980_9BILA|nr:hypothetical protein WR25_16397 [Diploscapter pachys]